MQLVCAYVRAELTFHRGAQLSSSEQKPPPSLRLSPLALPGGVAGTKTNPGLSLRANCVANSFGGLRVLRIHCTQLVQLSPFE